jgi:hypothetical protein
MAISLTEETLLSISQAARRLPPGRRGRPVSFACVLRWILDGIPGPDGQRVRLEAVRLGGRWLTSVEALSRFAAALTPVLREACQAPCSPAARKRGSDRAAKELARLGM